MTGRCGSGRVLDWVQSEYPQKYPYGISPTHLVQNPTKSDAPTRISGDTSRDTLFPTSVRLEGSQCNMEDKIKSRKYNRCKVKLLFT